MPKPFVLPDVSLAPRLHMLASLAWLMALGLLAWVVSALFWQFAAPPQVAAVARHETDARKIADRISLHIGRPAPGAANATARNPHYLVTGIATGFGTLPGFVILRAEDGAILSLSPGQALPDGRKLVRLLPHSAEFELDGLLSRLDLPAPGDQPGETLHPPSRVVDGGPKRDH
jgi:hypothetical protein